MNHGKKAEAEAAVVRVGRMGARAGVPALMACLLLGSPARGNTITSFDLDDLNSHVVVNIQDGMTEWAVNGQDQLALQWFWYRVGDNAEQSISTLPLVNYKHQDNNFNFGEDTLRLLFQQSAQGAQTFDLEVVFVLTGTDRSGSDIAETIRIKNTSSSPLDMHFYQYCDLDLRGTAGGDIVSMTGGNTASQQDGGIYACETVLTPVSSYLEAAVYDQTLVKLTDGAAGNLADQVTSGPVGADNVTWAFQWDFTIAPGGEVIISKDKLLYPEPGALALLGLGGAMMLLRRRLRA